MKSPILYSTSCAFSDAVKSLKHYGVITIMRVVGLALFVTGLFIVTRLAASIYADATESQDQTALREIKITVGTDTSNFTDERLKALSRTAEIEHIARLYTILPTFQYRSAPIVATLESASRDWGLFEKERMRVGRGLQQSDETVLAKSLADRLGIKETDVEKGDVEVTITQERTHAEVKESYERLLKVVGICRGNDEVGYILESEAAKMAAWAAGAIKSMDGRVDIPASSALAYLKKERFSNLEEYAARNKLKIKEKYVMDVPKLQTSTWAEINQNKIDPNTNLVCPTYIANYQNETFVIVNDADPRLQYREIRENNKFQSVEAQVVSFPDSFSQPTTELLNDAPKRSHKEDARLAEPAKGIVYNANTSAHFVRSEKTDKTYSDKTSTKGVFNVKTCVNPIMIDPSNPYNNIEGDVKSREESRQNNEANEEPFPYRTEETKEEKIEKEDEWKNFFVKDDCDVLKTFGFKPQGKNVRLLTRTESELIVLDQKTLAGYVRENEAVAEKSHIYLETSVNENEVYYRRAIRCNAIRTFTEQAVDKLVVYEIGTTENTPEETKKNLVEYLRGCDVRFVKERAEVETTVKGVPIRLLGSQKNDPENKLRYESIKEEEETRGLELSARDAQALGSLDWKRGDVVELVFTRRLESGREQNVALKFRFLGINVETKIPMEDVKNIQAWQRDELEYDEHEARFVDLAAVEAARGSYSARILAKSTDDAIKLVSDLTTQGYAVSSSGVDKIESSKTLFKNLTSFVTLFNISGLALCLLNIITTDFLVIRLRKNDVAAMIDLGVRRQELFKEVFAETIITASLACAAVVILVLTAGKTLARSLLTLTGAAVTDVALFDHTGVKILIGTGALTLALALIAQISTVIFLVCYKRPKYLRK